LAEPVAVMMTLAPTTMPLVPLRTVTVMVVVLVPSAVSEAGLGTIDELVGLTRGAVNVTFAVLLMVPATNEVTVLTSGVEDCSVAVKIPAALVLPEIDENVLVDPVDDNATV
jgi:hypothetical protein